MNDAIPRDSDNDDPGPDMAPDVTVDARSLLCPRPVLMLGAAARRHPGALVEVLADDPAAATDIPAWCRMRGASLVCAQGTRYLVRIKPTTQRPT